MTNQEKIIALFMKMPELLLDQPVYILPSQKELQCSELLLRNPECDFESILSNMAYHEMKLFLYSSEDTGMRDMMKKKLDKIPLKYIQPALENLKSDLTETQNFYTELVITNECETPQKIEEVFKALLNKEPEDVKIFLEMLDQNKKENYVRKEPISQAAAARLALFGIEKWQAAARYTFRSNANMAEEVELIPAFVSALYAPHL